MRVCLRAYEDILMCHTKNLHTQCNIRFNILIALLEESEREKTWIKKKIQLKSTDWQSSVLC